MKYPTSIVSYALLFSVAALAQDSLPQVDLGYEIHQAASYNDTAQIYAFNNIRYAQPPVGELRFAAPVPPTGRNTEVQTGNFSPICPQSYPVWQSISTEFARAYAAGNATEFNYTEAVAALQAASANVSESDILAQIITPDTTEDCLFLDVVVPKSIFDNANNMRRKRHHYGGGAPVVIWIYGGAYVFGSKQQDGLYNPSGLIASSQANGSSQGIIYVAMNYRLGGLGWLAGPTLQAAGGVSNAALYDQRLAIKWVKDNIHLFGGDPSQITVMGESAGGGSIMHQITAYGGKEPIDFQRAIPMSPGWLPVSSTYIQDNATETFLSYLNVSSIEEARNATSQQVILANILTVAASEYGTYTFGPVVDGNFVTTQPGLALLAGAYNPNISVLTTHLVNEGPGFTPPYVRTDDELRAWITSRFPSAEGPVINTIINDLYPSIYDGTYPWTNDVERIVDLITELIFTCNTNYLDRAYGNMTYSLIFQQPPSQHGDDVPSTFYTGSGTNLSQGIIAPVAEAWQSYITNFIKSGDPNGDGLVYVPMQGANASALGLNATFSASTGLPEAVIEVVMDPAANERCVFWQKGYYL